MDRQELKIQGILERMSNIVVRYENEIADIRAGVTMMVDEYTKRIEELQKQLGEKNVVQTTEED